MDSIGDRIRDARKKCGLSMQSLHDITGLSTGNISDIENNKYMPSVASLLPLSRALKCSIDWLVTGEDTEPQNSENQKSECKTLCDGVPLTESESDLIAMYRLLDERDSQTIFDLARMKYEQTTGEKGSSYSTYTDTGPHKNGPQMGFRDTSETA